MGPGRSHLVLAFLLTLPVRSLHAQQTDSLWNVWNNISQPDSARLKAMQALSWRAVFERPDSGIALAEEQLQLAIRMRDPKGRFTAYNTLAVGHKLRSDHREALEYFEQCLEVARQMKDRGRMANTFSNMSTVYKDLGDQPKALDLLQQSLRIDLDLGNKRGIAGTYNNIGNTYKRIGDQEKALTYYQQSEKLYEELGDQKGQANALVSIGTTHNDQGERLKAVEELLLAIDLYKQLGIRSDLGKAHNNLGQVYGDLGRTKEAFEHLDEAQRIFQELGLRDPLARSYYYRGHVLLREGRARDAITQCGLGLAIADSLQLLAQQRECNECLMQAYAAVADYRQAYRAQSTFLHLSDSLDHLNDSREVTRLELTRTFQEKQIADSLAHVRAAFQQELIYQAQLARERTRRYLLIGAGALALLGAAGLYGRLRIVRRSREAVRREKQRSDDLLHNILPEEVAAELKEKGHAEACAFSEATVLFTDFKGFTALAEQLSPAELVAEIDACFKGMDLIVEQYGLEKIKTIGDAYMAAAGLPDPGRSSATDMVLAALDMQDLILRRRTERLGQGKPAFQMRVGIHTGPVIAGIVGVKKFAYDIWGDTVNIAARMESSGEAGRVNISAVTYDRVKGVAGLRFEARGLVQAKGKGEMEMYYVLRA